MERNREEGALQARQSSPGDARSSPRLVDPLILTEANLSHHQAKLDVVTVDDQAAIEAVHDERALTELIGVLGRATSAPEVRAALTALRAGM
jgi:hypothetical protein